MKINEILSEAFTSGNEAKENLNATLAKYCQPYFNVINEYSALSDKALYRGVKRMEWEPYESFRIVNTLEGRRPLNTRKDIHALVDNWCLEKFGIRFRSNSLFCSGDARGAESYGKLAIVVPADQFNYLWSPKVDDLFMELARWPIRSRLSTDEPLEEIIIPFLENSDYQFNTGLAEAIRSDNEIMLACKSAVLVNPQWVD